MNKIKYLFIFILAISIPAVNAVEYKSFVDPGYGFYKIREITTNSVPNYDVANRILAIKQGDVITWINDADSGNRLTISIVSEQTLWSGAAKTPTSYTFSNPGTYKFYMKEYPSLMHLTVNVGPGSGTTTTNSSKCAGKTTYAKDPGTGVVGIFPTVCDVPVGWLIVDENTTSASIPNNTNVTSTSPTTLQTITPTPTTTATPTPAIPARVIPVAPTISSPMPTIQSPEGSIPNIPLTGYASIIVGGLAIIITRKLGNSKKEEKENTKGK